MRAGIVCSYQRDCQEAPIDSPEWALSQSQDERNAICSCHDCVFSRHTMAHALISPNVRIAPFSNLSLCYFRFFVSSLCPYVPSCPLGLCGRSVKLLLGFSLLETHDHDYFYSFLDMYVFRIGASSLTNRLVSSLYKFGTDCTEDIASNNSFIVSYLSVAAETYLSGLYLAVDSFF